VSKFHAAGLQIDTDLLHIITSTADELSGGTNINDLERPRTLKIWGFSAFFAISACDTHFEWIFAEIAVDGPRQPAFEIKLMLSRVSRALAQISCYDTLHCGFIVMYAVFLHNEWLIDWLIVKHDLVRLFVCCTLGCGRHSGWLASLQRWLAAVSFTTGASPHSWWWWWWWWWIYTCYSDWLYRCQAWRHSGELTSHTLHEFMFWREQGLTLYLMLCPRINTKIIANMNWSLTLVLSLV